MRNGPCELLLIAGSKVLIWSNAGGKLIRLAMERQMQCLVDLNLSMDRDDGSLRTSRFWLAASAVYLESAAVTGCSAEPLLDDQQIEQIFDPFFARFVLAPPDLAAHHLALAQVRSPGEIFQLDTSFSLSCARWTRAFCTSAQRTRPIDQMAWQLAAECCDWGFTWTVCWFASVRCARWCSRILVDLSQPASPRLSAARSTSSSRTCPSSSR